MVRILEAEPIALFPEATGKTLIEAAGLSTDTKPTSSDYATGSSFLEVDTGDVYLWDESSASWLKVGGNNE